MYSRRVSAELLKKFKYCAFFSLKTQNKNKKLFMKTQIVVGVELVMYGNFGSIGSTEFQLSFPSEKMWFQ